MLHCRPIMIEKSIGNLITNLDKIDEISPDPDVQDSIYTYINDAIDGSLKEFEGNGDSFDETCIYSIEKYSYTDKIEVYEILPNDDYKDDPILSFTLDEAVKYGFLVNVGV